MFLYCHANIWIHCFYLTGLVRLVTRLIVNIRGVGIKKQIEGLELTSQYVVRHFLTNLLISLLKK